MERKTYDLNHDFKFSAHTINSVCRSIRSMFRVLGIYISLLTPLESGCLIFSWDLHRIFCTFLRYICIVKFATERNGRTNVGWAWLNFTQCRRRFHLGFAWLNISDFFSVSCYVKFFLFRWLWSTVDWLLKNKSVNWCSFWSGILLKLK